MDGSWAICIRGWGEHHSGKKTDAERIVKSCVTRLIEAGHKVEIAVFSHDGSDDLLALQPPRELAAHATVVDLGDEKE